MIELDEVDKLRLESYKKGWLDGAGNLPKQTQDHSEDEPPYFYSEYDRGYIEGQACALWAFRIALERIKKPTTPS